MPNNPSTRVIYESVRMIHPDGTLMCRTTSRRAMWFIKRDLAIWENEGESFKLKFIPGGHGKSNNPYYTQERDNICVVCGRTDELNRHHVFPTVFRKNMSTFTKSGNSHDVLPICLDCHEEYEEEGEKFKSEILRNYGIEKDNSQTESELYNKKIYQARTMLSRLNGNDHFYSGEKLIKPPKEVIETFKKNAEMQLMEEDTSNVRHWGKKVMDIVIAENKLQEFVEIWRQHFIDTMSPQFLPKHWNVNAKLENISRVRDGINLNEYDRDS